MDRTPRLSAKSRVAIVAATAAAVLMTASCMVRGQAVDGYSYVQVDAAPAAYDQNPHTRYRDRDVYWVSGRWHWRGDQGRWYAFDREPVELHRWRRDGYGGHYKKHPNGPPPPHAPHHGPHYGPPPVQQAPPAY